jgi:hypothetical protein
MWAVGDMGVAGHVGKGAALIERWNGTSRSIVASPSPGSDASLTALRDGKPQPSDTAGWVLDAPVHRC